jgi:hypothetical protein
MKLIYAFIEDTNGLKAVEEEMSGFVGPINFSKNLTVDATLQSITRRPEGGGGDQSEGWQRKSNVKKSQIVTKHEESCDFCRIYFYVIDN